MASGKTDDGELFIEKDSAGRRIDAKDEQGNDETIPLSGGAATRSTEPVHLSRDGQDFIFGFTAIDFTDYEKISPVVPDSVPAVSPPTPLAEWPSQAPLAPQNPQNPDLQVFQSKNSAHDKEVKDAGIIYCLACDEPRYPGFKWCVQHSRVCDCTYRDAQKHKKTDAAKHKEFMAAHQEVMSNDVWAATKILQFEQANPVVMRGRKRGTFDHVECLEAYKNMSCTTDMTKYKWMDFCEYSHRQASKRGWTVGQSKAKWNWMLAQPETKTNEEGEDEHNPTQILINKGGYAEIGTTSVQEKAMLIHSKRLKSITEAEFRAKMDNLGKGHNMFSGGQKSFHSDSCLGQGSSAHQRFQAPLTGGEVPLLKEVVVFPLINVRVYVWLSSLA